MREYYNEYFGYGDVVHRFQGSCVAGKAPCSPILPHAYYGS